MAKPWEISSDDIAEWAARYAAAGKLPELVRRLLHATVPLQALEMRADGGVRLGGWDGIAAARAERPFCPRGRSGWELTVRNDKKKFDDEFDKRSKEPAPLVPRSTSYVAVSARRYPNKVTWVEEKKALGLWADVRMIDADDLAAWLEHTPAVARWFAREIGRPVEGFTDIDTFLERWSEPTAPHLPAAVAIAGRDEEAGALRAWLERPVDAPLVVRGDTKEEALVFAAAAIAGAPAPADERWRARALVVDSLDAFRWALTAQQTEPLILLPRFEGVEAGEAAGKAYVIVPLDGRASGRDRSAIELDRIPRPDLATALIGGGIDPQEAERLARESGGKLGALQRLCGYSMRSPAWAESAPRGPLVAMLFAGAWEEKNSADREVIARLGAPPEEVEALCTNLLRKSDAPVVRKEAAWAWVAPRDAWQALAPELTEAQLTRFGEVAVDVLGAPIPKYEAPADDELAAFFLSATQPQSSPLREGLATSVVLLAMSDPDFKAVHRIPRGSRLAEDIVRSLLRPEWIAWVSTNDVLPILAEAAPEGFLKALEQSLDRGATGIAHVVAENEARSIPFMSLFSALEILAWKASLTSRVIDVLARLSDKGADAEPAEHPMATLISLLHPRFPQSSLVVLDKLRIYERILRDRAPIGWKLGVRLLYSFDRGMMMKSERPIFGRWDLPPQDKFPTDVEIDQFQEGLLGILVEHADGHSSRWRELITSLPFIYSKNCLRVLDGLRTANDQFLDSRPQIWAELRDTLHELHHPRTGNVDPEVVSRVQELYAAFTPEAYVERSAWLFEPAPKLPESVEGGWDAEELRRDERRREALEELWTLPDPWASLTDLTKAVKFPYYIGRPLAISSFADEVEKKLLSEPSGSSYGELVPAFFQKRFSTKGIEWLDGVLRALVKHGRTWLIRPVLANIDPSPELWNVVDAIGDPVHESYWRHIRRVQGDFESTEWERAAKNLIDVDRVIAAIETASDSAGKISTPTVLKLLDLLGRAPRTEEILAFKSSGMAAHHLDRLLARLDDAPDVDQKTFVDLEGSLLWFLEGSLRSVRRLWGALESGPELFSRLIRTLYAPRDDSTPEEGIDAQERQAAARVAYQILAQWTSFPGHGLPAEEQEERLFEWATKALEQTRADGRESAGISEVAKVLARPSAAADGAWPCVAARRLLQEDRNAGLSGALSIAKMNRRGGVAKQLGEGGDQERELAAQFRTSAEKLQIEWPKVASLLNDLAHHYDREAEEEDHEAREDQLTYGKPAPAPPTSSEPPALVEPVPVAPIALTPAMRVTLIVENYRALRQVRWTLPRGVSALVGPNGSGKTTLLDIPELLRHALEHDVRTAVDKRGGPGNLRSFQADGNAPVVLRVELDTLAWQIDLSPKGAAFNPLHGEKATVEGAPAFDRRVPVPGLDFPSHDARPLLLRFSELTRGSALRPLVTLLKGYRLYGTYDLANIRKNGSQVSSDEHLHPDGRNIFSVLRNWRDRKETRPRWDFVLASLKEGFPDTFDDLDFDMAGQTVSGRIVTPQPDVKFPTFFASDGWLVALLHLAAVASTEPAGAVAIDEVENALHPYAIRALIDAMRRWAEQTGISIVLATHSPVVLDQFKDAPDHLFVMEPGREPAPTRLDELHDPDWLAHFSLGDLYAHDEFGAQHKDEHQVV